MEHEAIENYENICFCCLKEKTNLNTYSISGRGYGSSFDNEDTYLQICDNCKPEGINKWFDENPELIDGYCEDYKHEKDIIDFVDTFPIEGQELFKNRVAYKTYTMESQDWIDMKLGILPDEKYEEYCMYSPRQINAYKERFPICEHPVNAIFNDNSKASYCPFGASGKYGQETDQNISKECFNCKHYKVRENPLKEMEYKTYKKYELYIKGMQYKDLFE